MKSLSHPPTTFVTILVVLALTAGVGAAVAGIVILSAGIEQHSLALSMEGALAVIGGVVAAGLLLACAIAAGRRHDGLVLQRRMIDLLEQLPTSRTSLDTLSFGTVQSPQATAPGHDVELLRRMAEQLAELNANILLSEQQRAVKAHQRQAQHAMRLVQQIEQAMDGGFFEQAQQALKQLLDEVPDHPDRERFMQRLEQSRQAARARNLVSYTQRVNDLMAAGVFEQAQAVASQLEEQYPQMPEAAALSDHVGREAEAFHAEQRKAMYQGIEKCIQARQWRPAMAAARQFIQTYPQGKDSDLVRAQMATLADNAQLEEVRELRAAFLDMLNRQRFAEAHDIALDLVTRFPHTAAAEELRPQLEKLAERAKAVGAR